MHMSFFNQDISFSGLTDEELKAKVKAFKITDTSEDKKIQYKTIIGLVRQSKTKALDKKFDKYVNSLTRLRLIEEMEKRGVNYVKKNI